MLLATNLEAYKIRGEAVLSQTKLEITAAANVRASLILPSTVPAFAGIDDEDLLCGGCDVILCAGVSPTTFKARFGAPFELLVRCPNCEATDILPATLTG